MDARVQIPQLCEGSDVYTSLGTDFMPDWLETHPDYRIKALELGISNIDIFQIKILLISYVKHQTCIFTKE
jgi:hypothetical protein